jgi:hypothetical protein
VKVLICHNCCGFGVTVGPVLRPVCGPAAETDDEDPPASLRQESVVYPCQACDGTGFFTVAAAS